MFSTALSTIIQHSVSFIVEETGDTPLTCHKSFLLYEVVLN